MIRYRLHFSPSLPVIVSLDASEPDQTAALTFEGQEDAVYMIRAAVAAGWGLAGHAIGDRTTPVDLAAALQSGAMKRYHPELLEGAPILARHVRKAPGPGSAD